MASNAFTDFLINSLTGALQTVGESKLQELLQDLHDSNITDYEATIAAGRALLLHLAPLVAKSKTKVDDAIVGALNDAIEASAKANTVVVVVS